MEQKQIHVFEWKRVLMGNLPWTFLAEVAFRGVLIYVLLLFAIRVMGKRVAGQLSLSELAIMVTLGAAIGVPMEVADNGLLPGIVLLLVAIVYQRGIGWLSFGNRKAELLTQGDVVMLVADGVLDLGTMKRVGLSHERVFAALRQVGVAHLGSVGRLYLESSGSFSIFRSKGPQPGLPTVPPGHPGLAPADGVFACERCGTLAEKQSGACSHCHAHGWREAVKDAETDVPLRA